MANSHHHPRCPRCEGKGFYLRREGHGFYRDGSFGHNDWQDCDCYPEMPESRLPSAVNPRQPDPYIQQLLAKAKPLASTGEKTDG